MVENNELILSRTSLLKTMKGKNGAVCTIDKSFCITEFERMFALFLIECDQKPDNVKNKNLFDILPKFKDHEKSIQDVFKQKKEKKKRYWEFKEGLWLMVLYTPIFVADGMLIMITIVDKTEAHQIKQQHEQLRSKNEELQMISTSLQEKNQELEKAISTRDTFFGLIAHDLRAPIGSAWQAIQLLQDGHGNLAKEDEQFFIDEAYKRLTSVFELTKDLLAWANVQKQQIKYTPEEFNIGELIIKRVAHMKEDAEVKNISLLSENVANVPVFADRNMIKTVLRNLISNAIKFTHEEGQVTVSTQDQGNQVIICIDDTGVGISAESQKKLFQIDEHCGTEGTAGERSSGLGLTLCKEFVEIHKGRIWVSSEEGKGSKFCFSLPKQKIEE